MMSKHENHNETFWQHFLSGASTEIRHGILVLSLVILKHNEHFANSGQLLC